ncbi:hypothetical protein ACNHKD_00120 [Methylocystis sp. JAN1]|uniref:hypothetical protein n=1 Tax=Methylocystis sp. JAN1 TaxID=3397211 RepID=UPI003FA3038A
MSERSPTPLAVAIMGLLLAIISYAVKDESLGRLVYGSGLLSAGFALLHWFATPASGKKAPPRL